MINIINNFKIKNINWNNLNLIPVIVQDFLCKKILMLAWYNKESLFKTLEEKISIYWSRSKKKIWIKGEISKCIQKIKNILLDCDKDSLLININQINNVSCHTGKKSCFFNNI